MANNRYPYYKLIEGRKFTNQTPTEPGVYLCACHESEFKPYKVEIKNIDGVLVVSDPDVGTVDLTAYDLTKLLWKRVG